VRKRIATYIFVFLQCADFGSTVLAIRMGGVERNMLVSGFMGAHPVDGLILAKIIVLSLALVVLATRKRRVLTWANVFYSAVVIWNLSVIARLAMTARTASNLPGLG
jgi:hypothetical protein